MFHFWPIDLDIRPNSDSVQVLIAASINMGPRLTTIDLLVLSPQDAIWMVCLLRAKIILASHGTVFSRCESVLNPDDYVAPNLLV